MNDKIATMQTPEPNWHRSKQLDAKIMRFEFTECRLTGHSVLKIFVVVLCRLNQPSLCAAVALNEGLYVSNCLELFGDSVTDT